MPGLWDLSHIQPETRVVLEGDTLTALFWNGVAQRQDQVWLRQKELGIWRSHSWQQTAEVVREIAAGLISLGFARGEVASILGNTTVDWVQADLAILSCAGVANGTLFPYTTLFRSRKSVV